LVDNANYVGPLQNLIWKKNMAAIGNSCFRIAESLNIFSLKLQVQMIC